MSKLLIISTVPGTRHPEVEQALAPLFGQDSIRFFNVERKARSHAETYFCNQGVGPRARRASFFYGLTEDVLDRFIEQAVKDGIAELAPFEYGVLFLHSAFISPVRRSSYQPYAHLPISEIASQLGTTLVGVVSLHDDVYDLHKNLIVSRYIVRPPDRLTPFDSFRELSFLLRWRQLEMTAAASVARVNRVPHHLLHKKGFAANVKRMGFDGAPSIYLSHPISQSRRHWTMARSSDCPFPDPEKGTDFANEVEDAARRLAGSFAVVEPAAIDELRINRSLLEVDSIQSLLESLSRNERLLPPLTKRWPLSSPGRICVGALDECDDQGFRQVPAGVLPAGSVRTHDRNDLGSLVTRSDMLVEEIKDHITIRDYKLTDQSEVVLVFRPHSSDGSPMLSGGVGDEINAKIEKRKLDNDSRPCVFVVHPMLDEKRRRRLVFGPATGETDSGPMGSGYQEACNRYTQTAPSSEFREALLQLIENVTYLPDLDSVRSEMRGLIEKHELRFKALHDGSVMAGMAWTSAEDAQDQFVDYFVNGEMFNSLLFRYARADCPVVQLFDERAITSEIITVLEERLGHRS